MNTPRITIITVVYNSVDCIEKTIKSVLCQDYEDVEYIILDGGSSDGTLDIIKQYSKQITLWRSEPDNGIYDAMNRALLLATGVWVNFMNAGDCFCNNHVLSDILQNPNVEQYSLLYSDFYVQREDKMCFVKASYETGILLHQSVIYKRELHAKYGFYLVTFKYIVSDYLFFNLVPEMDCFKVDTPISMNSASGVSSSSWCWYQKICFDYIFRRISINQLIVLLIVRKIKNLILNLIR